MNVSPIRTKADYKAALREVCALIALDPDRNTADGDRLEILSVLVAAWEAMHHPVAPPDLIEAIKFRMEQAGLSVADLEPFIGRRNRVYEVHNRKRPLTLAMIQRLHLGLGISAEPLIAG